MSTVKELAEVVSLIWDSVPSRCSLMQCVEIDSRIQAIIAAEPDTATPDGVTGMDCADCWNGDVCDTHDWSITVLERRCALQLETIRHLRDEANESYKYQCRMLDERNALRAENELQLETIRELRAELRTAETAKMQTPEAKAAARSMFQPSLKEADLQDREERLAQILADLDRMKLKFALESDRRARRAVEATLDRVGAELELVEIEQLVDRSK